MPARAPALALAVVAALAGCPESHSTGQWDCTGSPCDDGDPCNGAETCDTERGCLPGDFIDCDDADPCTTDSCSEGACSHAPRDLDGDGHADSCAGGDDCAPEDPAVHPGVEEVCNDLDDDCDLEIDEGLPIERLDEIEVEVSDAFGGVGALLDGDVALGWTWSGIEFDTADASERIDFVDADASFFPVGRGSDWLVVGDTAWTASPFGEVVETRRGTRIGTQDEIQVLKIASGDVTSFPRLDPAPGQQVWPSVVSLVSIGTSGVPTLAYAAFVDGQTSVFVVPADLSRAPVAVARVEGRFVKARMGPMRDGGALLMWADRIPPYVLRLWSVVLSSSLEPTGVHELSMQGLVTFDACSTESGAVLVVEGDGAFHVFRLDRELALEELFEAPGSSLRRVSCRHDAVFVLEANRLRGPMCWTRPTPIATGIPRARRVAPIATTTIRRSPPGLPRPVTGTTMTATGRSTRGPRASPAPIDRAIRRVASGSGARQRAPGRSASRPSRSARTRSASRAGSRPAPPVAAMGSASATPRADGRRAPAPSSATGRTTMVTAGSTRVAGGCRPAPSRWTTTKAPGPGAPRPRTRVAWASLA